MQLRKSIFSRFLATFIVRKRLKRIKKQYQDIGGGSQILFWTEKQGKALEILTNKMYPNCGSFKYYIAFRYSNPLTKETLTQMKDDGITHVIALSQYPQFSCTTTGSSINEIQKQIKELGYENIFRQSIIDRQPQEPKFIEAVAINICRKLKNFSDPNKAVIVFSAHSIPMKTVNRGDPYVHEVHRTISSVMNYLKEKGYINLHISAWQSKVGAIPQLGPQTSSVLEGLPLHGFKSVLIVPVSFTNDHIETLYEIDVEYAEVARKNGIKEFYRSDSLNESNLFVEALADLVGNHLNNKENYSEFYKLKCAGCWSPDICRRIINPLHPDK